MSSRSSARFGFSLRTSVLSRLEGSIEWPVRWSRWDTTSKHSAWALGPSERPTDGNDGGLFAGAWPTSAAQDAARGGEPSSTKQKRGSGAINQIQAIKESHWQTSLVEDKEQSGAAARGPTQTSQIRESIWATSTGADGGSVSRGGPRKHEELQAGQVQAGEWCTPQQRDWKDTATQGRRKSPNNGTQANQADGHTHAGTSSTPTAASGPSPRRSTTGSPRACSRAPEPSTPAGGSP